jgi:hypothetical protein
MEESKRIEASRQFPKPAKNAKGTIARPVIDIKSQDEAIAKIVAYLRRCYDPVEMRQDYSKAVCSLMLKHGKPWYIGERTFAGRRARAKQCYMNAYALADSNPRMTYVEGWCCIGCFFEHAWCIDPDGQVIDPTLREADGYFGIPFRWEYVRRTASRTRMYGVIRYENSDLLTAPVEEFLYDPAR